VCPQPCICYFGGRWRAFLSRNGQFSILFYPLQTDIHLQYIQTFTFTSQKKKNSLHYRHRPVNVLYRNNNCLLWESHATHKFCDKIQTSEFCGSLYRFLPLNFKLCILSACLQLGAKTTTLSFPPLIPALITEVQM